MVEETSTLLPTEAFQPPTPPRTHFEHKEARRRPSGRFPANEPPSRRSSTSSHATPEPSVESRNTTTGSVRKKVGWAELADYKDHPTVTFNGGGLSHVVQPLPPSAERKPAKSILKAYTRSHEHEYNIGDTTQLLPPHRHANFAEMIESTVQVLAGKDRVSKSDAYSQLRNCLQASGNVPDIKALRDKMPIFCQYIHQDLNFKFENGKPDSAMITNILSLLACFLQKSDIAEVIPNDFAINFIEYGIKAFGDSTTSKEVVGKLMFVFENQAFSAKAMNQDRVGRLVTALHNVENHVKGKSIITGRLRVYRTLLRRSKFQLVANTAWVQDLFIDMLSSIKDIRQAAINFGLESSLQLGMETSATRAVTDLFRVEHSEGVQFSKYYASQLEKMMKSKDDSPTVPQIWSVIILFFRSKPTLYEQWTSMDHFMKIIQKCFNCSDSATKSEANFAWNRFIFAAQINEKTATRIRKVLCQPLIGQLKLRKSSTARKSTLNGIYTFLYYALSPQATPGQLDLYWTEFVVPIMQCLITENIRDTSDVASQDIHEACSILRCLFDNTARPWSETRAMEVLQHNTINMNELPSLDSKWLRSRVTLVYPLMDCLLEKLFWEMGDESVITKLWYGYIKSISSPAVMEVKVSADTTACVAALFGTLHRIWTKGRLNIASFPLSTGQHGPHTTSAFLLSFETITSAAIQGLGMLPFSEKLLSILQNTFIPIATPSSHPKKVRVEIRSPLHHLVLFLTAVSPDLEYDERFLVMVQHILDPFFASRKNSRAKMDFVKDIQDLLSLESTEPCKIIWQVLADLSTSATKTRESNEASRQSEEPIGIEYKRTIKVLEFGVKCSPRAPLPQWILLFDALAQSANLDAGDAGRGLGVIEPLAKMLISSNPALVAPSSLSYLYTLLSKATYPRDRQAYDVAKKKIWGTGSISQRSPSFDPYIALYEYIRLTLQNSYKYFSKQNLDLYASVASQISALLKSCPSTLHLGLLSSIQEGVACWIQDVDCRLGGSSLVQTVNMLWSAITNSISSLLDSQHPTKLLADLEILICSGLESTHKVVVNLAIQFWNSSFGTSTTELEYPERAKCILKRLRSVAEVHLPFWLDGSENDVSADQAQRIEFTDTQDDTTIYPDGSSIDAILRASLGSREDPILARLRQSTPQVIIPSRRSTSVSSSVKRSRESTPADLRPRKLRSRDITPRFRHNDSQIEFEAVPSSPLTDRVNDSQVLTEKQKETKERQQTEAFFPDLYSSPRLKTRSTGENVEPELELPLRRSSSISRGTPVAPRRSTPSPVPASEDDQFVASSPTPTRSLREKMLLSDPPSSPPESAAKRRSKVDDVPSSPPLKAPNPANKLTLSLDLDVTMRNEEMDGSKEADLSMAEADVGTKQTTISFAEQTRNKADVVPIVELATIDKGAVGIPAIEVDVQMYAHAAEDDNIEEPTSDDLRESQLSGSVKRLQTPTTPQKSSHDDSTARMLQFLDVNSSPTVPSSALHSDNEVFVDAVSSPRLEINTNNAKTRSSPLSDFDESSMLRIMADFDQGLGRTSKQVAFVDNQENTPRRTRASINKGRMCVSSPVAATSPMKRKSPRKSSRTQQQSDGNKEDATISHSLQTSSIPSLIPETPGSPRFDSQTSYVDDDGQDIDLENSIIVDTSRLEFERPTFKKRGKKRKHPHTGENANEVPESQDANSARYPSESPAKGTQKGPPPQKRPRGRPPRSSQVLPEHEPSFDLGPSKDIQQHEAEQATPSKVQQTKNLLSAEVLHSPGASKVDDTSTNELNPSAVSTSTGPEEGTAAEAVPDQSQQLATAQADDRRPAIEHEDLPTEDIGDDIPTPAGIIEETIDESIANEAPSSLPIASKPEGNTYAKDIAEPPSTKATPVPELAATVENSSAASQEATPTPTAKTGLIDLAKNTLRSLMGIFDRASFNRGELRELDDLLFDAKRKMYDAGSRPDSHGEGSSS